MNRRGFFGTVAGALATAFLPRTPVRGELVPLEGELSTWRIANPGTTAYSRLEWEQGPTYETLTTHDDPDRATWRLSEDMRSLHRVEGPLAHGLTVYIRYDHDGDYWSRSYVIGTQETFWGYGNTSTFRLQHQITKHYGYVIVERWPTLLGGGRTDVI